MHRLSRFFVVGALALLATPAAAQVVRAGDDVPGQPGAVPVTATDGRTAKVPVYIPVRPDGTVIDPAGGGGGASANQVQGNTASGTTETGNPVAIGGRVTSASSALATNNQRVGATFNADGSIHASVTSSTLGVALDGQALGNAGYFNYFGPGYTVPGVLNYIGDGTNLYYQRGNAAGSFIQGPSADLAAQVGNPVPVGCEFLTTLPTLSTGQGGQLRCTARNELLVSLSNGTNQAPIAATTSSALANTVLGLYTNSFSRVLSGSNWYATAGNTAGQQFVVSVADATTTSGVAPSVTAAVAGGQVIKAGAGNLFGLNVVSGASAGYVLVTNTTTVPSDGAVTPVKCYVLPANSSLDLNLRAAPAFFSVGISVSFSTTGCFTKTASATAFISGDAK